MVTVIFLVQIEPKNGFETEKVKKGFDSVDIYRSPYDSLSANCVVSYQKKRKGAQ